MSTVLLVEDDESISAPLTRALSREGYNVKVYQTGVSVLEDLNGCDLLILDLGLPDIDGLDVARAVRAKGCSFPILILTARTDEVDMVVGLDTGADDYVTKPFRLAELLARVRALLRRTNSEASSEEHEIVVQDIKLDILAHRIYKAGEEVLLSAKEFELLRELMLQAGNVVERDFLMGKIWGSDETTSTKTLDMHISWLRKKIGDEAVQPRYITTVRGIGFRFEVNK
ncbi:response regulator transcription factor [Actinomyces sp. zg-332]|uniref:response regulator transcription factor n=1 Tax=Actinomyces sp. zg-332 TaxID=2708340 RepID=UPI001420C9DB|nr:response regulator transcription factor [Actinomyces sp. zg-332]QPK93879.1 response regulator transcription factor [Actinomyces sp. zg-332]